MRFLVGVLFATLALPTFSSLLDPDSPANKLLDQLAPLLQSHQIDVARNLNSGVSKPRKVPRKPRLGMLADIPLGAQADAEELIRWGSNYSAQHIAGIAALPAEVGSTGFADDWLNARPAQRIFITYAVADQQSAQILEQQLEKLNYHTRHFSAVSMDVADDAAPRYYATAGQRLALDSSAARKLDKNSALEMQLLGKKLKRKSNSVFASSGKSARYYFAGEPDRFRKADLGDERVAATIPEIIVSGGIALGERVRFQSPPTALEFSADQHFLLKFANGDVWQFPDTDPLLLKACFDFAVRSLRIQSDAIIDIDERRRIKISKAFRNTSIGYQLIGVDEQPFHYVDNLSAIKSVIIDTSVNVSVRGSQAIFATEYEIRFINPDRRKLAETRVALVYEYDSALATSRFRESWGPRAFRLKNVDYAALGEATAKAAVVAGWSALFREVEASDIDFSRGRYEFLLIDKAGTPTPRVSSGG